MAKFIRAPFPLRVRKMSGEGEAESRYDYEFLISDEGRGWCEDYEILYDNKGQPYLVMFRNVTFESEDSEPEYELYNVDYDRVEWIKKLKR